MNFRISFLYFFTVESALDLNNVERKSFKSGLTLVGRWFQWLSASNICNEKRITTIEERAPYKIAQNSTKTSRPRVVPSCRAIMASAHNFLSNINSDQCPLSLLTFEEKRPVFLSSTKEKGRHPKRWSETENSYSNSCYENETRLGNNHKQS